MTLTQGRSTGKTHLTAEESHADRIVVPGMVVFDFIGCRVPVLVLVPSVTNPFLKMRHQAVEKEGGAFQYPVICVALTKEFPSAGEGFPVLQVLRTGPASDVFFWNYGFPCLRNGLVLGKEDGKALPVGTPAFNQGAGIRGDAIYIIGTGHVVPFANSMDGSVSQEAS